MKKLGMIYLFAGAMLGLGQQAVAETVQVGESSAFGQYVVSNLTKSKFEIVYPAERLAGLNGACKIEELAFPYVHSESGGSVSGEYPSKMKIYLENTTDAEVSSDFHDVSNMTLVYDGTVKFWGGSYDNPNWQEFEFTTPFEYTGRNLRMYVVKDDDNYSNIEWGEQLYWNVRTLMQISWGDSYGWETLRNKTNVFPVTRFVTSELTDPALTSDIYNWQLGNATIGETYTQTVTISGKRLTGDVTITPGSQITVDKTTISKADAEADGGATFTMTLTVADETTTADYITVSTPGCEDMVINTTWTPKWKKPDATITLNPTSVEVGDAPLHQDLVTTVEIATTGTLYNGITVSAPTTNVVTVSPLSFSNEELASGKVTLTVTINPDDTDISRDKVVLTSRGMDDIELPIKWNPVLGYDAVVNQIGECNDYTQKIPLFSTWEASESEMIYRAKDLNLKKGTKIRRIVFPMTFNSNAVAEEVTLSLANTTDKAVGKEFTDGMTQVAKVTKTIPAGGNIEQATPFYYLTFDLAEAFVYDGSNLRVRVKGVSDAVSERWYFSNDTKRKGEMPVLVRAADNEAALADCSIEAGNMQRTSASFPVIIITSVDESSHSATEFSLDSYSWVNGVSQLGHTYTKTVTVSAKNLKGDITVGTPTNAAVTVSPKTIAKADAEAGTATFEISLNVADLTAKEASFTLTAENADAVEYPVYWTPSDEIEEPDAQAGTISGWEAYTPLDLSSQQSKCEFVYRAEDLDLDGSNKYIKEIAYPYYHFALHGDADPFTSKVTVYVANTDATDVPNEDEDFTDVSTMTKVFEGNITFDGGSVNEPEWAEIPFDEKFLYTGGNLRIVTMHDCTGIDNISDQASFNKFYFGQDLEKAANQYCLYTYDNETRYNTGRHYPVVTFVLEDAPTVRLDAYSWEAGDVEVGQTRTKTVTVTASGLLGDIIISDPASSEVTVEPQLIVQDEIMSTGTATFTLTLTPSDNTSNGDFVEIFTEGGETITFPINWHVPGAVGSLVFDEPRDVEVFDVLGRKVLNTRVEGNLQTSLKQVLNQGIYVVKAGNDVYKIKVNK